MRDGLNINESGIQRWYLNGKLHREDGPAVIWHDGVTYWYQNNVLHREDGPAITYLNGSTRWYLNGKLHRLDGPAIAHSNNVNDKWFLNGRELTKTQWQKMVNDINQQRNLSSVLNS